MNKYLIRIPYSYPQYGKLYGFVYAEDEEEAEDLAQDRCNLHDDDYNDGDSGDSEYYYDEIEIELEESDIALNRVPSRNFGDPIRSDPSVPKHFLLELPALARI